MGAPGHRFPPPPQPARRGRPPAPFGGFPTRAHAAAALRERGLSYLDIAARIGGTEASARALAARGRRLASVTAEPAPEIAAPDPCDVRWGPSTHLALGELRVMAALAAGAGADGWDRRGESALARAVAVDRAQAQRWLGRLAWRGWAEKRTLRLDRPEHGRAFRAACWRLTEAGREARAAWSAALFADLCPAPAIPLTPEAP